MSRTETGRPTIVYAMTNSADKNEVVAFLRRSSGLLEKRAAFPTGGSGTGVREVSPATPQDGIDPLASQGSLALSRDGRFLFAVNAGSNSVSSFRLADSGALTLADVEPSGGQQPNALDSFGNILYVSNVGNQANSFDSNITGLRIEEDGRLTPIAGATYSLSTNNAQPARVLFSPNGRLLVVSELTTNRITVFTVNADGTLAELNVNDSEGAGPFGSDFLQSGILLVSEAGANAVSSYTASPDGELRVISSSVPTGQTATCWVIVSRDGSHAYASNTGSGTITIYRVSENGTLTFLRNVQTNPRATGAPTDSGTSRDGRYFYVLNGNQGTISVFRISNGMLTLVQVRNGLPRLGAQGLAVR